jgi:hypothetical protein
MYVNNRRRWYDEAKTRQVYLTNGQEYQSFLYLCQQNDAFRQKK